MQSKSQLINTNETWNAKKRYKINAVVTYLGSTYQNSTGGNSDPISGNDWFLIEADISGKEDKINKGVPNGYASLGPDGFTLLSEMNPSTLERLVVVADQAARFALTTATVQNGDTVKQLDTGIMYYVKDDTNLSNSSGYELYRAGTAASVPWTGVTGTPTSLTGYGIIPASGDYTTALVTETTDKNYQTDIQKLYNDATSSIQTQLNALALADFTSIEKSNILSQYNDTDVNYPADITWRPGKITEQNGLFKIDFSIDDLVKDKISKMKPYYCNYETGSNSNDGLTPATAVKTITYAYVSLGARLLYLTGGVHKSDSWGSLNSSFTNTDDFFVLQYGDKETYITNAPETNPTYSLQSGTTYQYTLSATANVIDMKYLDKKGFPYRMTLQTSIANVNANAGSFYISGSTVYINTLDGRVPDASILSLRGGIDTATYSANAGYHYVRGINFMGGSLENGTHGVKSQISSNSTLVGLAKDCKFMYGQDTGYDNNGGEGSRNLYNKFNITENCISYGNSRDGYNYLADPANRMYILEINCQAFQNGERLSSNSVNGSSSHNISENIRINGKYYMNSGPNIADVDGAITANYGVTCFNSIAPAVSTNVDFSTSSSNANVSKQYNYKVKSYNSSRSFTIVNTFESHIINKDVFQKGIDFITTPSAPQTITFTDFPTANVISPAFPALSAYTASNEYAPIASPTFTGDPKAPTPTAGDNDTSIATTAFVTGAIATAKPYKVYVATLGQITTGAPSVSLLLENTLGSIVWTRTATGVYKGTLTGAFVNDKTICFISYGGGYGSVFTDQSISLSRNANDNEVLLTQTKAGSYADEFQASVEIRVYP